MKITTEVPIFMEHGQTAHPIMQDSPSIPRPHLSLGIPLLKADDSKPHLCILRAPIFVSLIFLSQTCHDSDEDPDLPLILKKRKKLDNMGSLKMKWKSLIQNIWNHTELQFTVSMRKFMYI